MKQYKHDLSGTVITVVGRTLYNDNGVEVEAVITQDNKGRTATTDLGSFLSRHTLIK